MATKTITDASFATDVLEASGPVLVDFWAEWCGPCKMIGPSLEEISDELGETVTIVKLNIEDNPEVAGRLGIRGIPALYLYKNGEPVVQKLGISGIETKARLKAWLEGELSSVTPSLRA